MKGYDQRRGQDGQLGARVGTTGGTNVRNSATMPEKGPSWNESIQTYLCEVEALVLQKAVELARTYRQFIMRTAGFRCVIIAQYMDSTDGGHSSLLSDLVRASSAKCLRGQRRLIHRNGMLTPRCSLLLVGHLHCCLPSELEDQGKTHSRSC